MTGECLEKEDELEEGVSELAGLKPMGTKERILSEDDEEDEEDEEGVGSEGSKSEGRKGELP